MNLPTYEFLRDVPLLPTIQTVFYYASKAQLRLIRILLATFWAAGSLSSFHKRGCCNWPIAGWLRQNPLLSGVLDCFDLNPGLLGPACRGVVMRTDGVTLQMSSRDAKAA